MKGRPFILRVAAFLLVLVFSQKAGTGLFLHNLFHSILVNHNTPQPENEKGKDFSYNCTCIDDFLMPFDETEKPVCSQPVLDPRIPVAFLEEPIPFHTSIFSLLRGPPAYWL
ncbi:MAG: hypothetical protein IPQ06_02510 [Chitinophagaceae bacterium]|nr:hypothetical protein [Chitinophagaceae bacterium]MBK9570348.1 hypothetical protein [Chitinophagaceae bacterium]MBL0271959.1 hypothetical protein [Chitinophagaceae bacterium]